MRLTPVLLFVIVRGLGILAQIRLDYEAYDYYVLEHHPTGLASLEDCASALGLEILHQAGELENHWVARIDKPRVVQRNQPDRVLRRYEALRVLTLDGSTKRSVQASHARGVVSSLKLLEKQHLGRRIKRQASPPTPSLSQRLGIQDPIFPQQWHIINEEHPAHTMNVTGLWEQGITGRDVVSAIVDDGLDFESLDLVNNFDAQGSYDFNDQRPLPKPMLYDDTHGTSCAGEIAAVKNDICGVGIAYDSKVAGIRILSGRISDIEEATALNYGYQNTSIYSCSWGPADDGRSIGEPSLLIKKAILNGVQKGRGGRGSIFVFAAGNGATEDDQCNFDGYVNSIYSMTIAAVDHRGGRPRYSEACAANMVVAYSSGSGKYISTTAIGKNKCTDDFGGTSAAAPLAVGVFALALSVRPDLTWRDIQHLAVYNAVKINPEDEDWDHTFNGRAYNYKYGWGVLNAGIYVEAAKTWNLVKPQAWLQTDVVTLKGAVINKTADEVTEGELLSRGGVRSTSTITRSMMTESNLERIEHVTVKVWATHTIRGDLEVDIVSPTGVKSILAGRRSRDTDPTGLNGWTFMTVKHWGENGIGDWTIRVSDQGDEEQRGHFQGWSMTLWGESIDPARAKQFTFPDQLPSLPAPEDQSATSTKLLIKPTVHLPEDHGTAEAESDVPSPQESDIVESPAPNSTLDESWSSVYDGLSLSGLWLLLFLPLATVLLSIGFIIFRLKRSQDSNRYLLVPGEELSSGN